MEKNDAKNAVCSYVLVKIGDREKLVPAVEKLYINEQVLFCDAVDGDYDLVLLVQGDTDHDLDHFISKEIKGLTGVHTVETCRLETPAAVIIESASARAESAKRRAFDKMLSCVFGKCSPTERIIFASRSPNSVGSPPVMPRLGTS